MHYQPMEFCVSCPIIGQHYLKKIAQADGIPVCGFHDQPTLYSKCQKILYFLFLSRSMTVVLGCFVAYSFETYCPVFALLACSTYFVLLMFYLLSDFKDYSGQELIPRPHQMYQFADYNHYKEVLCTIFCQCCKPSAHVPLPSFPSGDSRSHRSDTLYGWRDGSNSRARTSSLMVQNNGQSR